MLNSTVGRSCCIHYLGDSHDEKSNIALQNGSILICFQTHCCIGIADFIVWLFFSQAGLQPQKGQQHTEGLLHKDSETVWQPEQVSFKFNLKSLLTETCYRSIDLAQWGFMQSTTFLSCLTSIGRVIVRCEDSALHEPQNLIYTKSFGGLLWCSVPDQINLSGTFFIEHFEQDLPVQCCLWGERVHGAGDCVYMAVKAVLEAARLQNWSGQLFLLITGSKTSNHTFVLAPAGWSWTII